MNSQKILSVLENHWPKKLGKGAYYDPILNLYDAIGVLAKAEGATNQDLLNETIYTSQIPTRTSSYAMTIEEFVHYRYGLSLTEIDDIAELNDDLFGDPEDISIEIAAALAYRIVEYEDELLAKKSPYGKYPVVITLGPDTVEEDPHADFAKQLQNLMNRTISGSFAPINPPITGQGQGQGQGYIPTNSSSSGGYSISGSSNPSSSPLYMPKTFKKVDVVLKSDR